MNVAALMMTTSELLRRDAELGTELDSYFDAAAADPRTWEANRERRKSVFVRRREIRDELNFRHNHRSN